MLPSLPDIKQRLKHNQANKFWYRALSQRASVCVIIAEQANLGPCLLMIQRAIHPGDTWSGHMAFPGGKHEVNDANITETAIRECQEEIGINPESVRRFGRLSDILARPYRLQQKPMVVSPILFETTQPLHFEKNNEVAGIYWIPLAFFMQTENRQQMFWKHGGDEMQIACYTYQGKKIWGISLIMIDEICQILNSSITAQ
jgi:8-oxo-dGTP pyrophosphatase MutT (NUDIX family)